MFGSVDTGFHSVCESRKESPHDLAPHCLQTKQDSKCKVCYTRSLDQFNCTNEEGVKDVKPESLGVEDVGVQAVHVK